MSKISNPENFAIVIGIDKYPDQTWNLKGAVTDAIKFAHWATQPAPSGGDVIKDNAHLHLLLSPEEDSDIIKDNAHLHLLLSPEEDSSYKRISYKPPTAANVDIAISSVANVAKSIVAQGSRLFFYFAGHGVTTPYEPAPEPAILLSDFELNQSSRTSMIISSITEFFKSRNITYQFFFFDACRDVPWSTRFNLGKTSNAWEEDGYIIQQFVIFLRHDHNGHLHKNVELNLSHEGTLFQLKD